MRTPEQLLRVEKTVVAGGLRLEREGFSQVASGELTLQSMLPNMQDVHGLLSDPLAVRVYDSPAFKVFSAVYTDNVFYGSRFDSLLDTIRPKHRIKRFDHGLGKWGTTGDWAIDKPRLIDDHRADLEPYWSEFIDNHRVIFIEALSTPHASGIENRIRFRIKKAVRRDVAIQRFDHFLQESLEDEEGREYRPMRIRLFNNKNDLQPFVDQSGVNLDWYDHRNLETSHVLLALNGIPIDLKAQLVDNKFLTIFQRVLNVDRDHEIEPKDSFQYLGDGRYKFVEGESWIAVWFKPDGTVEEEGISITDHPEKGLIPHLSWVQVKNTGQRLFLSSRVPSWITEGLDPRENTYLGLSVAKHLSGVNMPYQEHLSTRRAPQFMRQAQTVMQNSWRRSRIVNDTEFFPNFESFIESQLQQGVSHNTNYE